MRPPAGIPSTDTELNPFDVVVLSDVARDAIGAPAMASLGQWVERAGGGLLVAGGAAVFGERGYRQTEIERLAPVTFERRDEPSLALVLVLDRSWSMNGTSMELCKTAAQAAVDVMADEQALGVLTFDDRYDWNIPLRNVGANRADIRRKIADITAGGETLIFPALEQAYLALHTAKARVKHVVLLSDGKSYPDQYEALVGKMVKANITVSTVAVGPSADPELLRNIAQWGRGRAHRVADANQLPQIFVKEAKDASSPAFDENNITPVVKTPAFLTGVDLKHMPPLLGRTATVLKDTALEVLATPADDPLLAFWPIGLGRTAVFASDVKDRWAAQWVGWREYGPFFTALIRALERRRPPAVTLDAVAGPVHGAARSVAISVEARDTGRPLPGSSSSGCDCSGPGSGASRGEPPPGRTRPIRGVGHRKRHSAADDRDVGRGSRRRDRRSVSSHTSRSRSGAPLQARRRSDAAIDCVGDRRRVASHVRLTRLFDNRPALATSSTLAGTRRNRTRPLVRRSGLEASPAVRRRRRVFGCCLTPQDTIVAQGPGVQTPPGRARPTALWLRSAR